MDDIDFLFKVLTLLGLGLGAAQIIYVLILTCQVMSWLAKEGAHR